MTALKAAFFIVLATCPLAALAQSGESDANRFFERGIAARTARPSYAFDQFNNAYLLTERNGNESRLRAAALTAMAEIALETPSLPGEDVFASIKKEISQPGSPYSALDLADLHFQLGMLYTSVTNAYDSAILHLRKACRARTQALGSQHAQVAECYYQMGNVFKYYLSDFSEAERCYELSLRIREQASPRDTLELARTYYNLATTNRSQQDLERGLSYGVTAIELFKTIDHAANEERSYTVVANIYRDMGQWSLASEYYKKAIQLNIRVNKSISDLAWHYVNLGELQKIEAQYSDAVNSLEKALSIYNDLQAGAGTFDEDDKFLFLYAQYILAETYLLDGSFEVSLQKFREHINTLQRVNEMAGWQAVDAYLGMGHHYRRTGQSDSALYYYQKALIVGLPGFDEVSTDVNPTQQQIGLRYLIHRVLAEKANAYLDRYEKSRSAHDLDLALDCLILAEHLLTQQRNALDTQESRWSFSDDHYGVYEQIVEVLYEKQQLNPTPEIWDTVFRYLERSKARSLSEALAQAEQTSRISSDDSLLRLHTQLQRELFAAQAQLEEEAQKSNQDQEMVARQREKIVQLYSSVEHNNDLMEVRYPGYMKVTNPRTPAVAELKRISKETGSVVLDYFWGRRYVYLFALSPDKSLFFRVGQTTELQPKIDSFLAHFEPGRSVTSEELFGKFVTSAHDLYETLLDPVSDLIQDDRRLLIIPDGPLGQMPFEALITVPSQGRRVDYRSLDFVIRKHTIGYLYAVGIRQARDEGISDHSSVLGMAFTSSSLHANGLPPLAGAGNELNVVEERWPDGTFLRGGEVTESNFKTLAPDHGIIHLAIHGVGDAGRRYSSRLFFEKEGEAKEDSELHAYELYGLAMNAHLAVLTACESGLGKSFRGESMLSMASAFTLSGCANTVISLWKVNDNASVQLIDDFYAQLAKGKGIDEALSISKKQYLEQADELTAHPKFWASLVSYGNQHPIVRNDFPYVLAIVFFAGIAAFAVWTWRRRRPQ